VVKRYAQVGLPIGAVSDGEIVNPIEVSSALKRLWTGGGFTSNKVVLGISGPRVIVRQADVPALNAADLRSALKFNSQELIPIPIEDATFDFTILDESSPAGPDGKPMMRVLMVAAHKDLLHSHLAVLDSAGLKAVAIDPSPLALMRVVPTGGGDGYHSGVEVVVSIGAELTTVGVREHGIPRFIRSLTVGGSKLTETIANSLHLEMAAAERLKRGQVAPDSPQLAQARKAMSPEIRELAEDVRATVDFFISQAEGTTIDRLLVTGGASQTDGLAAAIAGSLTVQRIDPFVSLSVGNLGLDSHQLEQAAASATTAIGLALWHSESPLIRLSVLPEEVLAARKARKMTFLGGALIAAVAAGLALGGVYQMLRVHDAREQVKQAQAATVSLTNQVNSLTARTALHGQVEARAALVGQALTGDVDWVRLLGQLAQVIPPGLTLTSFSGQESTTPAASGTASSSSIGTLSYSIKGTGGLPEVSDWLNGLAGDPDVEGTWVSGISVTTGSAVSFSSTDYMTTVSESNRAAEVQRDFNH
jgi:type IV pilus assembly protein PilM